MSLGLRIGSLCSGIGGFELGLEQAGLGHVVWQVEPGRIQREILARHWPNANRYRHVQAIGRTVSPAPIDLLCGGFPCQDLSVAGRMAGLVDGNRSSLFFEVARVAQYVRAPILVLENVVGVLGPSYDLVVRTLAALGYRVWWDCVPAAAVGAPHVRDRWFLVGWLADAVGELRERRGGPRLLAGAERSAGERGVETTFPPVGGGGLGDPDRAWQLQPSGVEREGGGRAGDAGLDVADAAGARRAGGARRGHPTPRGPGGRSERGSEDVAHTHDERRQQGDGGVGYPSGGAEPDVCGGLGDAHHTGLALGECLRRHLREEREAAVGAGGVWERHEPPGGPGVCERHGPLLEGGDPGDPTVAAEPGLGGAVDGVPAGVGHRPVEPWERSVPRCADPDPLRRAFLEALGAAVSPPVARVIGLVVRDLVEGRCGT